MKKILILLICLLIVGCTSSRLANPQMIVLNDDALLDSNNVWNGNNTFNVVVLANGGSLFDNATCTLITSPNGTVFEFCD